MYKPYANTNSKCIRDLNKKAKIIKLLGENIKESLCDSGVNKEFLRHKNHTIKKYWIYSKLKALLFRK